MGRSAAGAIADPGLGDLIRSAHRAFVKALAQELEPLGITTANGRRKVDLRLTAAGRRLETKLLACAHAINEKATRGLPRAQVGEARALLNAFIANLEATD